MMRLPTRQTERRHERERVYRGIGDCERCCHPEEDHDEHGCNANAADTSKSESELICPCDVYRSDVDA